MTSYYFVHFIVYFSIILYFAYFFASCYRKYKPDGFISFNHIDHYLDHALVDDGIQNEAYVCKTNADIFDDFYNEVYFNLYDNVNINRIISQKIRNNFIKPSRKQRNNKKKSQETQCYHPQNDKTSAYMNKNVVLHIWPSKPTIPRNPKIHTYLACQNEVMKTHFITNNKTMATMPQKNIDTFHLQEALTFDANMFSQIIFDQNNLYKHTHKEQMKLLENIAGWLQRDGFLIISICHHSLFNDCSKKRNLFLSTKNTAQEMNTGDLRFDKYDVKTVFRCSSENLNRKHKHIMVKEAVKFRDSKKKRYYEYCLHITPLDEIIKKCESLDLYVKEKISLGVDIDIAYNKQYIYIFQKRPPCVPAYIF